MKVRIQWINCAKFVAILAVLVDHSYSVLYTNRDIAWASYFSVSLFIMISGMTSYISNQTRINEKWYQTFWRSSSKILYAYLIASFICLVMKTHSFNLKDYCVGVLKFNIQGPFYFVALYLQLMLINRTLFNLISKSNLKKNLFVGGCILVIATITTRYTNIFDIYGGGGKLFGGTYLFCYYIGMILIKYNVFTDNRKKSISFAITGILGYLAWWNFVRIDQLGIDSKLPFGRGMNPPSISLVIMALTVLCAAYGICMIFQMLNVKRIVNAVSWLGTHTLYIFLYHRAFLDVLSNRVVLDNSILKCVIYFGAMIFGPVLIEYGMKMARKVLIRYKLDKFSLVRNKK